jgi:ribosome maturation factor RimP
MNKTGLREKIKSLAERICRDQGLQLIDVEVKGDAGRVIFQIYADSLKGITLGECEQMSRLLMDEIDMNDDVPQNYRLDVSSPGLDRPLESDFDFQKNIGYDLSVQTVEEENNKTYTGQLLRFDTDFIYLDDPKTGEHTIPRAEIRQARIKLKW